MALKNKNEEKVLLTHDDVVLAYRLMLGRDPENADVVNNLCQTVHTVAKLREVFIGSAEFQQRMGELLGSQQFVRQRHPFNMPSIPVEVGVSEDALAQMFERIHQAWEYLGETDPYWSVVTQPQYHMDQFESHKDQFFKSGKYSADLFFAALRRNHVNPNLIGLCLEVGCGVGRVTNYLAQTVAQVLGADISAHHLDIARDHLVKEGRSNVTLKQLTDIRALNDLPSVDAIFSVITLQHNPPPVIAWMLRTLLGCLKPSGVAYLQIPTYRNGYLFEAERYLNTPPTKSLEMHFLPQHEIFKIVDESGCRCLEIREDSMVGEESKMLSNTFVFQKSA
jgi:SAM-dependent methyltransferase